MASADADWRIWAQRAAALALWLLLALPLLRVAALDRLWPQDQCSLCWNAQDALDAGCLTAARRQRRARAVHRGDRDGSGSQRSARRPARVALAAVAQAREATARDRIADAHRLLDLARELDAPRAAVEPAADFAQARSLAWASTRC